jgi:hypothetical protein
MDYKRIYEAFIKDRRIRELALTGYVERHHIIPRCMGGGDGSDNLIRLTPEDHIFAHLLLAKIYGRALWYPLFLMFRPARQLGVIDRGKRAVRIVAQAKRAQAEMQTGVKRPDVSVALSGRAKSKAHREKLSAARVGFRDSEETRAKKSKALRSRVHTPERNAKVSAGLKGREFSEAHRAKISAGAKTRYCGTDNPRHNKVIHTFRHEDGQTERLTKFEMAQKHGLNRTCLNYVISGARAKTQGWFSDGAQSEPR